MTTRRLLFVPGLLLAACGPAEPSGPASGQVEVLTYNVHGLPSIITGDDTPGRMEQIAPLLPDFDWIGLQDDFTPDGHDLLVGSLDHDVLEAFDEPAAEDRVYGSGLTIAAHADLTALHEEHYAECHGFLDNASDCLASKGFQVATFAVGDGLVDLYNTHFEAGGGDEDEAVRAGQVDAVIESMNGRSADRAVVFVGDMNLHHDDAPDIPLLARLADDAGLTDACEHVDCPEIFHIDRIFFRSGGGVTLDVTAWERLADWVDADGVDLSDHPPVAATLTWATE